MTLPVAPGFIVFQGRLFGTAHLISIAPPRADGGKHIIEARVTGGVAYAEEYDNPEEAHKRFVELATELLDDARKLGGEAAAPRLAQVTPLPSGE